MEQNNHGNQHRRTVRRRKVRYDRILIALAVVVLIFILFFSCTCSCVKCICKPSAPGTESSDSTDETKDKESDDDNTDSSQSGQVSQQGAVSLTALTEDVCRGPLVVVNANRQYTFPANDANLVSISQNSNSSYTAGSDEVMLDSEALSHLNDFMSEFSTVTGKSDVIIEGAYRSKDDQDSKYKDGSTVFAGGYSDYHTGRSFDICITSDDGMQAYYVASGDSAWINDNAYKYGFVVRYPEGKMEITGVNPRSYTFHYVGIPHSYYMKMNNLSLEEYVEAIKAYPANSPLTVDTDEGTWNVFYSEVPQNGGSAVVNIPGNQKYTVSGDNFSGVIVAYR